MMNSSSTPPPIQLYLSLMTLPVLGFFIVLAVIAPAFIQLGQFSEELFRGDRLPLLPFPWQSE